MNEDELIYRIRFEGDTTDISSLIDPNALQGLVDLGKEIEATKEQLDSYQKQVKLGFPLSEEDRKNVEQLKLKLNDLRKEYQDNQKAITNNDKALKANSNTYDGLVERNKALSQAMRELPLDDTTGALQRMQAEYNANNDVLKAFDASMGNHQRNVGNYKDAFEGLGGIFSMLPASMQGLSTAFMGTAAAIDFAEKTTSQADGGFKAFFKTLISNPLGLILIAVTALIGFLSKLKPVTEALEKVFAVFGATLDTVVGYVEALINATDRSTISFMNNARAALDALAAQKKLAAMEAQQAKIIADYNSALETQRQIFEDSDRATQDRIRAFRQYQVLLVRQKDAEIALAKQQAETAKQNKADLKDINDALANVKNLETERRALIFDQKNALADFQAQFVTTNDVVTTKLIEQKDAYSEILRLQKEIRDESKITTDKLLQNLIADSTAREQADKKRFQQLMAERKKQKEIEDAEYSRQIEQDLKLANQKISSEKEVTISKLQQAQSLGNSLATIESAFFSKSKAFSIAKATIDTYASAVAAFKDTPGPIFVRVAAAAAAIAAGIANVRKMVATQPGAQPSGSSLPTANMGPAMPMGMIGSAFNPSSAMRFGPLTTGAAGSAAPFNARETQGITVYANVDRKGLAIAVREGERQIKTQQFTFAQ